MNPADSGRTAPDGAAAGPTSFATPEDWRAWLAEHHETAPELLVGFWKRGSGRPSITWPESVDEALCHGWIDGVRRSAGPEAYTIRFTPRRRGSHWSTVNVARVEALRGQGRMTPAGEAAFAARTEEKTGQASFERSTPAELEPNEQAAFEAHPVAWQWFSTRAAPWLRRASLHWVVSAKRPATRASRLATLIECSAAGRPIPNLDRNA